MACANRGPFAWRVPKTVGWPATAACCSVRTTADARGSRPPQDPPAAEQFDFRTVEVLGTHVVGRGNARHRVMHSSDGGATWEGSTDRPDAADQSFEVRRRRARLGRGRPGTILVTIDGGRTWQKKRGARERLALFGVYSDAERVPLEALARLAANEGFISAVEFIARRDAEPDTPAAAAQFERERHVRSCRSAQASPNAPGAFPCDSTACRWTSSKSSTLESHVRRPRGRAARRTPRPPDSHLAPEIVVDLSGQPGGDDPLGHLVNQVVLRRSRMPATTRNSPSNWPTSGSALDGQKSRRQHVPRQARHHQRQYRATRTRLTRSLADYAGGARGLFGDRYNAPPNTWGFRLYVDTVGQGVGQQDFFSRPSLAAGSDARRELHSAGRGSMDAMRQIAEKHRNLQAILAHSERSEQGAAALLGQISDLTRGLDPETAGQTMFELAHTYGKDGHWEYAAATFQLLTEKYPATRSPRRRSCGLFNIGRAAKHLRAHPPYEPRYARRGPPRACELADSVDDTPGQSGNPLDRANQRPQRISLRQPRSLQAQGAKALEMGQALERIDAHAWSDLHVQFPLPCAGPRGRPRAARGQFLPRLPTTPAPRCLVGLRKGERGFRPARWRAAKAAAAVRKTAAKPRLDGDLADDVWQQAEHLELASPLSDDAQWPATVMLAYDDEFLYVAIDCRCAPQANYPNETRSRQRDADLARTIASSCDWMSIATGRPSIAWWSIIAAGRPKIAGATRAGTHAGSWPPTRGEENWTIEAAIPLSQLPTDTVGPKRSGRSAYSGSCRASAFNRGPAPPPWPARPRGAAISSLNKAP